MLTSINATLTAPAIVLKAPFTIAVPNTLGTTDLVAYLNGTPTKYAVVGSYVVLGPVSGRAFLFTVQPAQSSPGSAEIGLAPQVVSWERTDRA